MRQYEQIWLKLKALSKEDASIKGVSLTAPRALHRRIIKAVKKEKWLDVGYKLKIEPREATLIHTKNNSILTFYLVFNLISEDF